MKTEDGNEISIINSESSENVLDEKTGEIYHKPAKKRIYNDKGEIEELEEIQQPSDYDQETGEKLPKKKKYKNKEGKIYTLEEPTKKKPRKNINAQEEIEDEQEEPEDETTGKIGTKKVVKISKKPKSKIATTKDGKKVEILEDENELSEEEIDKKNDKRW